MPFNIFDAPIDVLNEALLQKHQVTLSVLRLDKIHPIVSGNKLFKLHYFLEEAIASAQKTILTFGGAYSNHLAATAFACKENELKSIGIVRGEKPVSLSHTLQQCIDNGMQLKFVNRADYEQKENDHYLQQLKNEFGTCTIVPEGGYHPLGAKGAALIGNLFKEDDYTHICTATGTATTLAGLLQAAGHNKKIISVPVLKGMADIEERIDFLNAGVSPKKQLEIFSDYHFGGYAKKTPELIAFMNALWQQYQMPTDFVYTAKLLFAIFDKIKQGYFPQKSKVLCLHTGGLQGNQSLPPGTLLF